MEAIGHLICLGTDQAVSDMIDLTVKLIQRNVLHLRHQFLHFLIDRNPEILIAP